MRSLSNRLRLSWLTVVALVAVAIVASLAPAAVSVARVTFAHDAAAFKQLLLRPGETVLSIQIVNLLRAQFAADMVFLVAYGLLLRHSVLVLTSAPFARLAGQAAILTMIADAVENIFALAVLRTLGDETQTAASWWFLAMNTASALKWALAAAVMLSLSGGWCREARTLGGWRRRVAWVIVGAFAIGGVASLLLLAGLAFGLPGWISTIALAAPAVALLLQFRLLDTTPLMVRFLYLARVPFVMLVMMAAFGPIALGPAADLLGGILVAGNLTGVAVTTAAAAALLFACGTQINIVRAYSSQRALDESLRVLDHEVLATGVFWTGVVAAASLLFSVCVASPAELLPAWKIAAGIALGTGGALVLLFGIEWIAARLSYNPPGYPMPELAVPFRRVPFLANRLIAAANAPAPTVEAAFRGVVRLAAVRIVQRLR